VRVTPEQKRLILSLVVVPGVGPQRRASAEELLAAFGTNDGKELCGRLLQQAIVERSAERVELTLILAETFGLNESSLPTLQSLAREEWHGRHEDISRILEQLGGAEVVDDLEFLAWAGPEFQEYEGSTSLAKKAVHSLERIATPSARSALARLRRHPEEDVRALVERVEARLGS
jgi:hypothetical protein